VRANTEGRSRRNENGESWMPSSCREGEVLVLRRGVPRLNDLGLAREKGSVLQSDFLLPAFAESSNTWN